VLRWRNLPEVRRWMYTDHEITEKEHDQWFESVLRDESRQYWVIMLDEQPVGVIGLNQGDSESAADERSFGVYIGESSARGSGAATSALTQVFAFAFSDPSVHRVSAEVLSANEAAIRAYARAGMVRSERPAQRTDAIVMLIDRATWTTKTSASLEAKV